MRAPVLLLLALLSTPYVRAQQPAAGSKRIVATRVTSPIRVDGLLDESEWSGARFVDDFTQKDPVEGASPSERTELAIRYDDDALYVGARMFRRDPSLIHRAVTRRDESGNTERLIVSLDTYRDRRTAYSFVVTAAGGRTDYYHASDDEFDRDHSFNPVWDAETRVDASGWTAEMRIPFSQLRFSDAEVQEWGINIDRWVPDLNEDIYWVMVPKDVNGWSSRMGELVGLDGIRPSMRLELLPYVAGQVWLPDSIDAGDPFDERFTGRAGLDLKLGIGSNLTVDATINPDFGQVEADPANVNLTDFETTFEERRPFFVEGAQLLRGGGATYFYSRRIGARPHVNAGGDYVDAPDNSTILAAAKLTGRLPSGLSVGALGAVTEREEARIFQLSDSNTSAITVEPLTGYGVVRLQQEFGESQSTVGVTATLLRRDLEEGSQLARILPGTAVSGGVDYSLRFDGGAWELNGYAGGSHVQGDSVAIEGLQRSSARYYGRPDAGYVEIDPSRRSLSGYTVSANLERNAGKWRGYVGGQAESPGLELNDLGQISTADDIDAWAGIAYHENEPGDLFRNYRLSLGSDAGWNYGGVRTYTSLSSSFSATLPSFWSVESWGGFNLPSRSDGLSRGGPLMGTAFSGYVGAWVGAPYTWKVRGSLSAGVSANVIGGWDTEVDGTLVAQVTDQLSLTFTPHFARGQSPRQFMTSFAGGNPRTYDRRYVFARLDETYLSAQLRVSYVITPRLSLDLYAEPYSSSVRFYDYGELPEPGTTDIRRYAASGATIERSGERTIAITDGGNRFELVDRDFTYLSFRSNVVLRWEWLPGSTAYVVWQRGGLDYRSRWEPLRPRHVGESIGAFGEQVFAIKVAYWIPVG